MSYNPLHPQLASQASRSILPLAALSLACILPQAQAGKVVIGAADNTAGGPRSVVAGGKNNTSTAGFAFIGAGRGNKVEASDASVLGGNQNTAAGAKSSVLSGYLNNSSGLESSIVSGIRNITSTGSIRSAVLSGTDNVIEETAWSSYIGGGYRNSNAGDRSAILMGTDNIIGADALNTVVAGIKASSNHRNSFVFNSSLANPLATTKNGQFLVNATGGVILNGGTTIQGPLTVSGGLSYEGGDGNIIEVEGPQGETGSRGPKGDTGEQGPVGPQGPFGPQGPIGAQGAIGPAGPQGPAGQDGAQGPAGVDGADGADGTSVVLLGSVADFASLPVGATQGDLWLTLDTGDLWVSDDEGGWTNVGQFQGPEGPAGQDGVDGADGAQGPKGDQGVAGPAGQDGADGAQGPKGDQGVAGPAGQDGADGAQGPKGDQGVGVSQTTIDADGNLIVTLTNGSEINAGQVGNSNSNLKLSKYSAVFDYTGGTGSVDIQSDTKWIASQLNDSYGWVTVVGDGSTSQYPDGTYIGNGNQTFTFEVAELTGNTPREAALRFESTSGPISGWNFTIRQEPNPAGFLYEQLGTDIDGEAEDDFSGRSVSLSADGSTVAIGASRNDGNGSRSGHVRVYQYINSSWQQLGADINGEAGGDASGWSVSLSADGSTVAIGAPSNDVNGYGSGHVRIYQYINSSWQQLGTDIDGEAERDQSGYSVSLSADGDTIAIGASYNQGNGIESGHVRIYQYINSSWQQLGTDIDGEAAGDLSGSSVSLSVDGSTVAIGAPHNDGNGFRSGHTRIYQYINSSWQQLGTDIDGEAERDQSGWSVSLSADGSTVAIGAYGNDVNGSGSGHVRIYQYINSSWQQLGTDIDGEAERDQSGYSVSLSADGDTIAIGASYNQGNGIESGHVRIYQYINSSWQQLGTDIDGEAQSDESGYSVSLSADGNTVAIGAPLNDGNGNVSGHVRIYELTQEP